MKHTAIRNLLVALSITSSALLLSPSALADGHAAQCGKTELASQMKEMKKHLKGYKKASRSDDWDTMATHREALTRLTIDGQDEIPYKAQGKPEDEKQAMTAKYRKGMEQLETLLEQLAAAEAEKDSREVKSLMKKLGAQSKKGHKAFKLKCDKD